MENRKLTEIIPILIRICIYEKIDLCVECKWSSIEYRALARVQGTAEKCLSPYERIEESSMPSAILQINLQYAEQARSVAGRLLAVHGRLSAS